MSDEDFSPIQPRSVPLSHAQTQQDQRPERPQPSRWPWYLGGALILSLTVAVFTVVPKLVQPTVVAPKARPAPSPGSTEVPAISAPADDQPAPFAALLREQARGKAQAELSRFVELQLQLEESMQVGSWGQAEFDAAKALATQGDEEFVKESFDTSLAAYDAAATALAALIEKGANLLNTALNEGEQALASRDQPQALDRFEFALTIDPENLRGQEGLHRATLLPEIIVLLRQGKNYELAGNWTAALLAYQEVEAIDPATEGLADILAGVREGVRLAQVRTALSDGFNAMDNGKFKSARSAFQTALKLDPGNQIALGGLEQVSNQTDLSRIEMHRRSAASAEQSEDWDAASASYDAVLALDANIQFAKDGRQRARNQLRSKAALGNIVNSPDKLSSPQLFSQAKELLARAKRLEPRGPLLARQIEDVEALIRIYATPVEVTFKSDNTTRVTVSTVGVLGTFDEKRLTLRPGAYTVIGSRDGCRDVRESILVRPDMQPVEIRCSETF